MACALESLASSKYCLGGVTDGRGHGRGGKAPGDGVRSPLAHRCPTVPGWARPRHGARRQCASATVQLAAAWPTSRTPAASTEHASGGGSEGLQLQAVRPPTPRPGAHVGAEEA